MSLNIVVFIKPEASFFKEFGLKLATLKELTVKESGCDIFDFYIFENKFVLIERWTNQVAIDAHMEETYTKEFINQTKAHLERTEVFRLENIQ
ncbi:putative quinol monooxygenase [Serratia fonticola]|uniref:putative quinol monooxygenase n=1 Tax=Serratia fonticola TaxID=47917 RepID=UPI003AAC17FB